MNSILRLLIAVLVGLALTGCATTRVAEGPSYPYDPWYADLEPFSKDRVTDWALFDLGCPNMPDLRERSDNPLYDLEILFK